MIDWSTLPYPSFINRFHPLPVMRIFDFLLPFFLGVDNLEISEKVKKAAFSESSSKKVDKRFFFI